MSKSFCRSNPFLRIFNSKHRPKKSIKLANNAARYHYRPAPHNPLLQFPDRFLQIHRFHYVISRHGVDLLRLKYHLLIEMMR